MEEGPAEPHRIVRFCMSVNDRKETPAAGFRRVYANFGDSPLIVLIVMSPFFLWIILGRIIAIATCKIPQWPAEINAACAIEANDPYAIRGEAQNDRIADTAAA